MSATRAGADPTIVDEPLLDGAGVTKRDPVDYLDAGRDRLLPGLRDRPLFVVRVCPGRPPFMQKNLLALEVAVPVLATLNDGEVQRHNSWPK